MAAAAAARRGSRDVTLRLLYPEGCLPNVEPVQAWFTELAGVRFENRAVPVDLISSHMVLGTLAERVDYDVALPATFALPDLVDAGALAPLDELAAEHEPPGLRDGMLHTMGDRYRGALYGYQTDGDAYLMFYNRDLLEDEAENAEFEKRHGRPLAPARTWEDLDQMMAFFRRPGVSGGADNGSTLFRTPGYTAWEWWIRFHAKGRYPMSESLEPAVDSAEGIAALEELIAASGSQYRGARSNGLFDNWDAFASGRYCCNIGWGGTMKALRQPGSRVRDRLIVAPPPGAVIDGAAVPMPYFNWGWNYTVPSAGRERELAYLFCLFAVCPEPSVRAVRQPGFFDPFRAEHYGDSEIVSAYGQPFLATHESALSQCIPDLYLRGQSEYLDSLRRFVSAADRGEIRPREALSSVADSWRRLTERVGADAQVEPWRALRARYPAPLREWLQ